MHVIEYYRPKYEGDVFLLELVNYKVTDTGEGFLNDKCRWLYGKNDILMVDEVFAYDDDLLYLDAYLLEMYPGRALIFIEKFYHIHYMPKFIGNLLKRYGPHD
jgi:hypothetical protein